MKAQRELVLTVGKKSRRLDLATIGDHKPLVVKISASACVALRRAVRCWPHADLKRTGAAPSI